LANDIITQLQARNETLTQAIARYGSLNATTLQTLSAEQTKVNRLMQQLNDSATRLEKNGTQRAALMESSKNFIGQAGHVFNVEAPDWKLPFEFQDSMVNMAMKGGLDNSGQEALSLNLRDWSLDFNQEQKTLQSAATLLIDGGTTALQDLNRYMPDIAKAATATRDSAETWAMAALPSQSASRLST